MSASASLYPKNLHPFYHAHLYFDADTVEFARQLAEQAGNELAVRVGRVHERAIGPHPSWSCQLSFSADEFDNVIPWLDSKRNGLTILVHGVTGDDLRDHTEYAYWLGIPEPLKLDMFR